MPATLVNTKVGNDATLDLVFDAEGSYKVDSNSNYILNPAYSPMKGSLEERFERLLLDCKQIDGRWMLAAQHLESWRSLWAPNLSQSLPSLEQLMTWLISMEYKLEET